MSTPSKTLLVRHADVLVTMDDHRREISNGGFFAQDGFITQVDETRNLPQTADEIVDMRGHIVLPGLINTHHHLYQTLTRAVPAAQDADLFHWLKTLYPIWARLTPAAIHTSTQIGLAELALSGCTTASDHLYIFPNGCRLDDEIEAAAQVGLRFHASRGSMSMGESQGGLPPDSCVEDEEFILRDSRRLIEHYDDPRAGAMLRVVLAPCSPFSVSGNLMRESAKLARAYGVGLHTHLAETQDEEEFCIAKFGHRPVAYMNEVGWLGAEVWFAHSVHVNDDEIKTYARCGCGVAHCPTSNMRLASGIAPIRAMRKAGVKVGLGVDGSASNDGSHLLAEARQAMLLARLGASLAQDARGRAQMPAREALEIATLGGAAVLGRTDVGSLSAGKCADFFSIRLNRLTYAGGLHDPVAAAIFCAPQNVDTLFVHGRAVVQEGELVRLDIRKVTERHNQLAREMVNG